MRYGLNAYFFGGPWNKPTLIGELLDFPGMLISDMTGTNFFTRYWFADAGGDLGYQNDGQVFVIGGNLHFPYGYRVIPDRPA